MLPTTVSTAVLASVLISTGAGEVDASGRIPTLKFEKYKLPNGLDVILYPDHSTPIVCVNVWYHVGSKNERRGRTGFAHLFEHMMFQGSEHHDSEYFGPLQEAGGRLNGSTNDDRTNYWEVVPSNYLELALWLESDRMGFLLPAMSQEKLDNQRDVVKNERRQSYENRPYGLAHETIVAAMYPHDHPYSWPTIGYMDDITAASRADVAEFFRTYYHPGNASLCLAGDFDVAHAKRLIEQYFGSIPAGPPVGKLSPLVPVLAGEKRITMHDRVGLPRLYLNWHTVEADAPDDAELDLLASILAGGKSSRLYRSIVLEKQLAQDVSAYQQSGELAGSFSITATAKPGVTLTQLESAIVAELARIQAEPPTGAELEKAVNRFEAQFVVALESVGGFGGIADRLNRYNVMNGDPGHMAKDFGRYLQVDAAGVSRVARTYLTDRRVVLEVLPGSERTIVPDPMAENAELAKSDTRRVAVTPPLTAGNAEPAERNRESFDRSIMPKPAIEPKFVMPPIQRSRLSNGLELVVVEHHELPIVSFNLLFRSGNADSPPDRLGLANLVAAMVDEGTRTRSANDIADQLASIGASLSVRVDWDTTRLGLFSLKRHLPHALEIFSDVLLNPTFPANELNTQRGLALTNLLRLRDQPNILATFAVNELLYGSAHPYGRPEPGNSDSLSAISRDDIVRFFKQYFVPNQATLIVVGDVTVAEITERIESAWSGWNAGEKRSLALPAPPQPSANRITVVNKPGAAQSVICVAQLGELRKSPRYFPLIVLNTIFGGQFSSRLNMNLREDKGYTYGARSSFEWRQQPGPYIATASVQTSVTAPALVEFLKEFRAIAGPAAVVTAKELDFAKASLIRGYPAGFETAREIAGRVEDLVEFELPDNYFETAIPRIAAVTAEDVIKAGRQLIDPERLTIVIVGDQSQIEQSLHEALPDLAVDVREFDEQFKLVEAQP